ncbi:fatty acyl-AMP ligase [Nonomuraea sp. NPDC052265]|uniref:fatty acyl-AMP ligase n=1 Tax=Nonomuraea sp. NPDC052265 TaxID=3364374 RepID=UPI0037CAB0A1
MTTGESSMTLCAAVRSHALHHPERPAIGMVRNPLDPSTVRWWTYAELHREAQSVAAHLRERADAGSRVLLTYPAGGEFVTALLGCLYADMIAVPSSLPGQSAHSRRRVLSIARDADFSIVLAAAPAAGEIREWADAHQVGATVLEHDGVSHHDRPYFDPAAASPDTVAILQYTSGSTGHPKGSVVTHGNFMANATSLLRTFGLGHTDRLGGWIPNYHDMGLGGIIVPPLFAGCSAVLMDPTAFLRRPAAWLKLISTFGVTFSAAPNFGYRLCNRRVTEDEIDELDLTSWKHAANGSEPVDTRVVREFTQRFARAGLRPEAVVPCYGMAEATVFVSASPDRPAVVTRCDGDALAGGRMLPVTPDSSSREVVSCGRPRDLDVRIVAPASGTELADGEIGEIWLRGRSIVAGYWDDDESTARTFGARLGADEGFLRTGDLGALVDGELYVTGRIKEMLIVRGRNIYPHDVEQEVRLHHDVLREGCGAAVMVPDESGGERLVLMHEVAGRVLQAELAATALSIRQVVVREFGVRCDAVVLLRRGAVRRTTSGKIERSEMRRAYLAGELRSLFEDAPGGPGPKG